MNALTMLNDVNDLFEHALEHGWSFAMVRYPHFTASPNPALVTTDEDGNMWAAGWGEAPGDDRTRHMVIDAEDPRKPLSDARLAESLKASGVPVARRTVAKYREAMQIAASHERVRID